jgi:glutamyl-tRNA synthetase
MTVVTRFAPSPTGFLHIGSARTALFNWLFARHHGGHYLLRIEDTDRKRSTPEAVAAILDGLEWLGLSGDEDAIFQFTRRQRHAEVAQQMLEAGTAYYCYASAEELADMRATAKSEGRAPGYDGRWRDRDPADAPAGVAPAIRLKAPQDGGEMVINDLVQGRVVVAHAQLDDMILLRADGTPTYMLSVVVDDHDMGITHVIRGDDHLNNAFRQSLVFKAMGWALPKFAHIPLIHGADGGKLSKRHGALGVDAYRDLGYVADAVNNYLLRLGWSHGDDEIISRHDAVTWFDLDAVGRAAARFDFAKLDNLNGHYLRAMSCDDLIAAIKPQLISALPEVDLNDDRMQRIKTLLPELSERATKITELADSAHFLVINRPIPVNDKAQKLLTDDACALLATLNTELASLTDWTLESIKALVGAFALSQEVKLGAVAQALRAALTGGQASPGIFEVMVALGNAETTARLNDICGTAH